MVEANSAVEELTGLITGDLTLAGMLGVVFLLVIFGRLIPKATVDREQKKYEDAIARADGVIATQAQTILELTVAASNSTHAVTAIAATRNRPQQDFEPPGEATS